eukprot:GHVU01209936.1.p4 GENE.GHVU01209936.1~~GHVU01209936.1.p4  ORF type:complete len:105 (-),score=23.59 GHVU01209936.1:777-1091(-)
MMRQQRQRQRGGSTAAAAAVGHGGGLGGGVGLGGDSAEWPTGRGGPTGVRKRKADATGRTERKRERCVSGAAEAGGGASTEHRTPHQDCLDEESSDEEFEIRTE